MTESVLAESVLGDDVRVVLLAGGRGERMGVLGAARPKPLIPFGGQCRLIDFSLANARASGASEVLVLSYHDEQLLIRYLLRTWDRPGRFRIHFGPHDQEVRRDGGQLAGPRPPERGTAEALLNNARFIFDDRFRDVLVLHADHVYTFDYGEMLSHHRRTGAALTIAFQQIEPRYVSLFGMVKLDEHGYLTEFTEKPDFPPASDLVFAAFCFFRREVLARYLAELSRHEWSYDISRDVIPAMLRAGERIAGFRVDRYWEDIGTIERYHRAHVRLLGPEPTISLRNMPLTLRPRLPRRITSDRAGLRDCLVAADLVNGGMVERSVVYPGVTVAAGAVIRGSVLLPGCEVAPGIHVEDTIVLDAERLDASRRGLADLSGPPRPGPSP